MSVAPALAQQPMCDDSDKIHELMSKKYEETPIAIGITGSGSLVELLVSPHGETWTLIISTPDGRSCFLASGEGWHDLRPKPKGQKT